MTETLIAVALGWVLGVAGTLLLDKYQSLRKQKRIDAGIRAELGELRHRMVLLVYLIEKRSGGLNRELLQWVGAQAGGYSGTNPTDGLLSGVDGLLSRDDAELDQLAKATKAGPQEGLEVQTFALRFIDSRLGDLDLFDPSFQAAVLEIRTHLDMHNQMVERVREYQRLTHEGDADVGAAIQNAELNIANLGKRARIIAERTAALLSEEQP